jgi:nitroreductase
MADHPKHASTAHEILDIIRRRWSPRAYDPGRDISDADLRTLFEAARWAPSSYNEQPWRFVVADRRRTPDAHQALLAALRGSNPDWAGHAPTLALVAVSTRLAKTGDVNRSALYDAGQAVGFLVLQATHLDISVRQMEGFDRDAARAACAMPSDFEPVVVLAIGYVGDPAMLATERHRAAEQQPRQRAPIGAFVFEGRWGNPIGVEEPRS